MHAHKRPLSETHEDEDPSQNHHAEQRRDEPEFEQDEAEPEDQRELQREIGEEQAEREDSESSSSGTSPSGGDEKPEFISVELPNIRKDVQCPICLGIIKKTRTVMECLHRFCRECIDKSMRLGNNECPACRTHCASRRSLRDDPNYDALIAALYPDIDKYEEQELAFHEEERNRNKQIQAAIAQIFQRQAEALAKRRALGKDTAGSLMARPRRNHPSAHSRRRKNSHGAEFLRYEDNDDENGGKASSSTDERSTESYQQLRRPRIRPPRPSLSAANSDGGSLEKLVWGRGGVRSHKRNGISSHRNSQNNRLSKLVGYLRSLEEEKDEVV